MVLVMMMVWNLLVVVLEVVVRFVRGRWRIWGVWEELRPGPGGELVGVAVLGPFSVWMTMVMRLIGSASVAGVAAGPP